MGSSPRRYGSPEDLAEHITANFFPITARNIRRQWREQHGLDFIMIGGRALAAFEDAEKIAAKILKIAGPASMKGPLASRQRTAKKPEPDPEPKAEPGGKPEPKAEPGGKPEPGERPW